MSKTSPNIHDLQTLDREIALLQQKARKMEKTFDNNFDHLQDNFHRMAWNSLISTKRSSESSLSGDLLGLLGQSLVQGALGKILRILAGRLVNGLLGLVGKLFGK